MTHICGTGKCGGTCDEWKPGDEIVCLDSAFDPQLLKVDCALCLAKVSKELREG